MSKDNNNLFADIVKLANSAIATTASMKNELTKFVKYQIESFIAGMDFVKREEFEVVKKMATQNALALEKITGKKGPSPAPQKSVGNKTKKPINKPSAKPKTN
ncbi:MAG: accessory factor UbiK family protein [Candidatus Midichloria sp.]|uniref:Accessory factor UbiK family protein n=1 Tax=Hyalomma marginatum TaxID=34627 RepID=A0A8S4BW24_9ACAR|nr:accessory factor UbiK family protein [Hyalomma marginatum]CAG7598024.1 accessory factor UbiK family protein [Hyalomma marginatum]